MKTLLVLGLITFGYTVNAQPIANAGPDQTIYLTQTSTATLNGSGSSGDSYQWTDITNTVQNPLLAGTAFNGFPANPATITSPTSATTTVTGLIQGVWYYQIAVTTSGVTKYDSCAIIVDYDAPPANSKIYLGFPMDSIAPTINARNDTTSPSPLVQWATAGGNYLFFNQGRSLDMYVDAMRRKFYGTIEDGYQIPNYNFPMSEASYGLSIPIDTNKTYVSEWKGYFPQSDSLMLTSDPEYGGPSNAVVIWELHSNDSYSPPFEFLLTGGSIYFDEIPYTDQVHSQHILIGPFSDFYNKTNTLRIEFKEGIGNGAYIKVSLNGVQKYLRNTGTVGRTFQHDYIKFNAIYDYAKVLTSGDAAMRSRGRKFSLVTESYKVYTMPNGQTSNVPPVANAGSNQTITLPVNTIILSGSGTDADGTISSYLWTKISGPSQGSISNPNSSSANVSGLVQGIYQFQLTVTDNSGATGTAIVQVTVNAAPNAPPTANAGSNQSITLPTNSVSLSGSGSDPDGTINSYLWTKISGPSTYTIVSPDSATTNISGLVQGVYYFQMTVTDNDGNTGTASVRITVNAAANQPPTANAGSNQNITLPTNSIYLSGSGTDTDGTIASYQWTEISGPSAYSIASPNSATTNVTGLVQGVYQFQLTVTDNSGGIGTDAVQVIVNAADNIPPTANAGPNQNITLPTNSVTLSGSGTDPDGTVASYQWSEISGPTAYAIASLDSASTNVTGLTQGVYQFQLKVTDNSGDIGTSTVQVSVNPAVNIPPTANAGSNQSITLPTNTVILTGSGSDADGTIASYQWTKISGPSVYTIAVPNSATTNITELVQGVYQFQLTVTDNNGAKGTSSVQVAVNATPTIPPVADAGSNISITLPANTITLTGSGSDADGTIASYNWTKISGPSTFNIVNPTSPVTDVSGLLQGVYQFQLTVTDNDGNIGTDIVKITVNAAPNIPPTANAGSNQSLTLPSNSITLSGSGSDADGTISSYQWTKISGPLSFTIVSPGSATTNVSGLEQGVYQFQLAVTDNNGAIGIASVRVTVNPAPNIPPTANAGTNKNITLPTNSISLAGSGSDADGTVSSYQWTKISGPSAYNIVNPSSPVTDVSGLVQGVYHFQLTVTDNKGGKGTSSVQVTVNPVANIPPTAYAGANKSITLPSNSASLTGSGSDADGTISTYRWTKISGPSFFNIVNASSPVTDVSGLVQGVYKFQLTVTDNQGDIGTAIVQITVNGAVNVPPVANAGSDKSVTLPTNSVSLSGSGSDADGTIASYQWSKISGPSSYTIASPNSASTNVSGLVQGIYQFQLTVTDNKGASDKATVQVTVNAAVNMPPTANAGSNKSITLPTNSVSLAGSGSDGDGTIASYQWSKISGPSSFTIASLNSASTNVSGLVQGVYQFQLTVTDNLGATGTAIVQVTVNQGVNTAFITPNIAPKADAGNDTTIVYPDSSVTLKGSGTDADGSVIGYLWNQISGPSSSTILANNTAITSVTGLAEGTYEFQLTVTDNKGSVGRDTVTVSVALGRYAREENSLKVYPNPVHNIANLEINTGKNNTNLIIVITNISGKTVYRQELVSSLSDAKLQIDMSNLIKGTYVITVLFDGVQQQSIKVLKM